MTALFFDLRATHNPHRWFMPVDPSICVGPPGNLFMFGGVGIYAKEAFFALVDDDVLYLKVDDSNRGDFEARGMSPFQPFGRHHD